MQTLKSIGTWVRKHFDFALLLAALVEIPRWTVTFLAIHEPLWVGIPLGALLAYATSEGWRAYFANPSRVKLLCFNIASLAAATFVITPVLFSMASAPIDEIDLSALLPFGWLLAWSGVLAVTTFAPLIQLAAVKSTPPEYSPAVPSEATTAPQKKNKGYGSAVSTVPANPDATGQASEGVSMSATPAEQPGATSAEPQAPDAKPRRLTDAEKHTIVNMSDNGMRPSAIASTLQLNENTVRSIINRASKPAVHHNGIAKEHA